VTFQQRSAVDTLVHLKAGDFSSSFINGFDIQQ